MYLLSLWFLIFQMSWWGDCCSFQREVDIERPAVSMSSITCFPYPILSITPTADLRVPHHNTEIKSTWCFQAAAPSASAGPWPVCHFKEDVNSSWRKFPGIDQLLHIVAFISFSMTECFFDCTFQCFSLRKIQQSLLCVKPDSPTSLL